MSSPTPMLKMAFTRLRAYLANMAIVVTAVLLLSSRAKTQNVSDSESASVLWWTEEREGPNLAGPLQRNTLKRHPFYKFSVTTTINAFTVTSYHVCLQTIICNISCAEKLEYSFSYFCSISTRSECVEILS
jgi:hypothetical protein